MTNEVGTTRTSGLRMRRTRGGLTGLGLVLLGAWGAIIPFVGPYFNYAYTPNGAWTMTSGRLFLEVIPGAITFFAGLILLGSANRLIATIAGWLAVLCGAWFVIGPLVAPLWQSDYIGHPVGGKLAVSVEQIGMFYGLGAAIILLASFALGRVSVRDAKHLKKRDRLDDDARGADPYPNDDGHAIDDGHAARYPDERSRDAEIYPREEPHRGVDPN